MSRTRILCSDCGFPLVYCDCPEEYPPETIERTWKMYNKLKAEGKIPDTEEE